MEGESSGKSPHQSPNSNCERKISHHHEERLAIISINSLEVEREEETHLKSPSKFINFFDFIFFSTPTL